MSTALVDSLDNSHYSLSSSQAQEESDRLNLQHNIFLLQLNGLYAAPVSSSARRVLDVGCGTGIFTRAYAAQNPQSQVIGIDLDPPSFTHENENVTFYKANAEGSWDSFASKKPSFDFIFGRMLLAAIQDWDKLYNNIYSNLRPQGWVELQDIDGLVTCDDPSKYTSENSKALEFSKYLAKHWRSHGCDPDAIFSRGEQLQKMGFVNIESKCFEWRIEKPDDKSAKLQRLNSLIRENTKQVVTMLSPAVLKNSSLSQEERVTLLKDTLEDFQDNAIERGYKITLMVWYAQKP